MVVAGNNVRAILDEARHSGVVVWVEGEQLRFRAPAGGLPSGLLERLRAHEPQVIAMLFDDDAAMRQVPSFRPRPRPDTVPIIGYHHDRWNDILAGRSGPRFACSTHFVASIGGAINLTLLTQSFRLLAARHTILTARVADEGEGPCFVYESQREITPTFIDLSLDGESDTIARRARQCAGELIWAPFELRKDPWFRAFVISLSSTDHIVGFVIHHFIADNRSIAIAARELYAIYSALAAGRQPTLPTLGIQYHDYVLAVNEWLQTENFQQTEAYWREHLSGAPTTRIPPDFVVDPDAVGLERIEWFHLPDGLTEKLRACTRGSSLRMHVHLTAALSATLAYFSRSNDILMLHRISRRTDATLLDLIGAFYDAMAVRVPVDLDDSFARCVERTQQVFLRCHAHSTYPFSMLKQLLNRVTESGIAPMLNFIDAYADRDASLGEGETPDGSGVRLRKVDVSTHPVETHVARNHPGFYLTITHTVNGMQARIEYFEHRYTEQTIARFMRTLTHLLEDGLTNPAMPLRRLLGAAASRLSTAENTSPGPGRSADPGRDSR